MKLHNKFTEDLVYFLRKYLFTYIFGIAVFLNAYFMFTNSEIFTIGNGEEFDLIAKLQVSFILNWSGYFTPVLVALPHVMRFHEEKSSGAYRFGLVRSGQLKYVFCKVRDAAVSGALVMACSLSLFVAAVSVYAFLHEGTVTLYHAGMFGDEYTPNFYYDLIIDGKGIVVFLINCMFLVGYSIYWSCIGTVVSFFIKNKRIALAGPFIFQRVFDYIIPRSMSYLHDGNLRLSSSSQAMHMGGIPYAISYVGTVFVLSVTILYFGMEVWLRRHG